MRQVLASPFALLLGMLLMMIGNGLQGALLLPNEGEHMGSEGPV